MAPVVSPFKTINGSLAPLLPDPNRQPVLSHAFADAPQPDVSGMGDQAPSPLEKVPQSTPKRGIMWAPVPAGQPIPGKLEHAFPDRDPLSSRINYLGGQLEQKQQQDLDPYGSPDNHPGRVGKFLHELNVATGGVNRRSWDEMGLAKHLQDLMGEQSKENLQGAEAGNFTAETAGKNLENENAPRKEEDTHNQSTATTANLESETRDRDTTAAMGPNLTTAYAHAVNEAMKAGRDPATDPIVQHLSDAITSIQKQPVTPPGTKIVSREVGGKPHNILIDERTGADIKDEGESGEKPPTINLGAQGFQEQERGRSLLDKAETQYRTAQQGANGLRDMIAQADAGNKVSAQVLPLQGALEITTAQGVHRINRTEVDQYAGAGSLWDKVAGELGKVTSGQPIPANIRQDMRKLADIEEKAAYQNYKGAFDSASKRYKLTDEQPLPQPGGASTGAAEGQWEATATGKDGHQIGYRGGKWYDVQSGKAVQ
jgi:hypothetical protein